MLHLLLQLASLAANVVLMVVSIRLYKKRAREKEALEDSNHVYQLANKSLENENHILKGENEKLNQKINGARCPDKTCVGCKHLIIRTVPSPLGPCVPGKTVYICLKNVRCNEYEE